VGGPGKYMNHISEFLLFFSVFHCFLHTRPGRISWPTVTIYIRQNACFWPMMCLLAVSTISDYISDFRG